MTGGNDASAGHGAWHGGCAALLRRGLDPAPAWACRDMAYGGRFVLQMTREASKAMTRLDLRCVQEAILVMRVAGRQR